MSTTYSLALNKITINKLKQHYNKYAQTILPNYVQALFILPHCRITVYDSGKVVFQGQDAEQESTLWQKDSTKDINAPKTPSLSAYIGCDETGVGDYFLPLVVAACYIHPTIQKQISSLNIKDSKQLNDDYICQIAPKIKEHVPHAVYVLTNEQYNHFIANGYNAHSIKAFVHNKAINKLMSTCHLSPDIDIVMDAFASKKNYINYLKDIDPVYIPTIFETKAENKYLAVALASIVARAKFMALREQKSAQYCATFPLGAGKHVDTFGQAFLRKFGQTELKKNVKWHFANTNRIIMLNK